MSAETKVGLTEPDNGLSVIAQQKWEALKAGDTGFLPVIVALAAIVIFFYSKNSNYLSAGNFTNLITQMAGLTALAIGVVFVLLLGEIDLSIGYVSGLAGVVVAYSRFQTAAGRSRASLRSSSRSPSRRSWACCRARSSR